MTHPPTLLPKVHTGLSWRLRRAVESLHREIDGARAVLAATVDGLEIASTGCAEAGIEPARLAAIVSSLSAIGEVACRDCGTGASRGLHVEACQGRIVVRCVSVADEPVIIAVLTDRTALLGLVLNRLADADKLLDDPTRETQHPLPRGVFRGAGT